MPLNLSIDALATPLHRTRRYPIVVGKPRLHDAKGLLSTRPPVISDRESHFKRRKPMVGTLRDLSATMVAEDSRVISGNCCSTYFVQQTPSPSQVAITIGYPHQGPKNLRFLRPFKRSSHQARVSGVHHGVLTADAGTLCYPQKK
jgi:hypothetical protein